MIKINDINISYQDKVLIANSSLVIKNGQVTLIYGKSGCGKTSLLYLIGLFNHDNCKYYIDNLLINNLNDEDLSKLKRSYIGYVFQDSTLFEHLDPRANLKLYASLSGRNINEKEIKDLLLTVNLNKNILNQDFQTLSGGEKQRLAIACALCKEPKLLVLDEPTSALDHKNEESLYLLLKKIAKEKNIAVVIVSHSLEAHKYGDTIYEISNRRINLVRDCKSLETKRKIDLGKVKSINKDFFKTYIKFYKQKNHNRVIISMLSMLLLVIGNFGGLIFLNINGDRQREEVTNLSENQVFIINKDKMVDKKIEISVGELYQNPGIKKIYPYSAIKIFIDGNIYDVIPYFEENIIDSKISQYVDKSKTVFISNNLLNSKMSYLNLNNHIKTSGFIIGTKKEVISIDFEFDIAGYLKSGVISGYLNNNDPGYVMMPYSMLQKYYDKDNCCGYTIFFESYSKMLNALDETNIDNVFVNSDFQNIEVINASLNEINVHLILIAIILVIVFGLQYFFVQYLTYRYRNNEFAILNINGLSKQNIQKMINKEYLIKFIITIIMSIIVMIITMLILGNIMLILYLISMICSIVAMFIFWIAISYHLKNLKPIDIIRN